MIAKIQSLSWFRGHNWVLSCLILCTFIISTANIEAKPDWKNIWKKIKGPVMADLRGCLDAFPSSNWVDYAISGGAGTIDHLLTKGVVYPIQNPELFMNLENSSDSAGILHNIILREYFNEGNTTISGLHYMDFIKRKSQSWGINYNITVSEIDKIIELTEQTGENNEDYVDYLVPGLPTDIDTTTFKLMIAQLLNNLSDNGYRMGWDNEVVLATNNYLKTLSTENKLVMGCFFAVLRYSTAYHWGSLNSEKADFIRIPSEGIKRDIFGALVGASSNGIWAGPEGNGGCTGAGLLSAKRLLSYLNNYNFPVEPNITFDSKNPFDSVGLIHNRILNEYIAEGNKTINAQMYYDFIEKNKSKWGLDSTPTVSEYQALLDTPYPPNESTRDLLLYMHNYLNIGIDFEQFDDLVTRIMQEIENNNPIEADRIITTEGNDYINSIDPEFRPQIAIFFSVYRHSMVFWRDTRYLSTPQSRLNLGLGGRFYCNNVFSICKMRIPGPFEPWEFQGQMVWANLDKDKLTIDFTEYNGELDTALNLTEDLRLDYDVAKTLGGENLLIKAGTYEIDYSTNKYGTVIMSCISNGYGASCELARGSNCDPGMGACLVMFPTDKSPKQIPFVITNLDTKNKAKIEFLSELDQEGDIFNIDKDIELGSELSILLGGKKKKIIGHSYPIDYSTGHGFVIVDLNETITGVNDDNIENTDCLNLPGTSIIYFDLMGKQIEKENLTHNGLYFQVIQCASGERQVLKFIGGKLSN
ncbi:MAG: hypothetical protein WC121_13300 [Candidatus Kapaibacterium sp.]